MARIVRSFATPGELLTVAARLVHEGSGFAVTDTSSHSSSRKCGGIFGFAQDACGWRTAASTYHTSVDGARKSFWATIRSLKGGSTITPDRSTPKPADPLPAT